MKWPWRKPARDPEMVKARSGLEVTKKAHRQEMVTVNEALEDFQETRRLIEEGKRERE